MGITLSGPGSDRILAYMDDIGIFCHSIKEHQRRSSGPFTSFIKYFDFSIRSFDVCLKHFYQPYIIEHCRFVATNSCIISFLFFYCIWSEGLSKSSYGGKATLFKTFLKVAIVTEQIRPGCDLSAFNLFARNKADSLGSINR